MTDPLFWAGFGLGMTVMLIAFAVFLAAYSSRDRTQNSGYHPTKPHKGPPPSRPQTDNRNGVGPLNPAPVRPFPKGTHPTGASTE